MLRPLLLDLRYGFQSRLPVQVCAQGRTGAARPRSLSRDSAGVGRCDPMFGRRGRGSGSEEAVMRCVRRRGPARTAQRRAPRAVARVLDDGDVQAALLAERDKVAP